VHYRQKLTELDEITKRLQSRLRDVTNAAFEDDFDNDFDMAEQNSDNENIDDKNIEIEIGSTIPANSVNTTLQVTKQCETESDRNFIDEERQTFSIKSSNYNPHFQSTYKKVISSEPTDACYYSSSNTQFNQHPEYYHSKHNQYQDRHNSTRNYLSDNIAEYPPRGTKTHINHLLDKLSLDLPPRPPPGTTIPIKKDIFELFANLREHRINWQDQNKNKSDRNINTRSVVTQTDKDINEQHSYLRATNLTCTSNSSIDENVIKSFEQIQPHDKISTVIREELITDENNDNSNCDELTTYLITSNIRHMDLDNIFNPLLYQYLIPDLQVTSAIENKAIEQLDNRYDTITKNFNKMTHNNRIDRSIDDDSCRVDVQTKSRTNVLEPIEKSTEVFRLTPSGISANIDNNIDLTLIHKINDDNDLMSANSMESTATLLDKLSLEQVNVKTKNHYSTMSELSVPGVSRQAPEGGNPVEEIKTSVVTKQQNQVVSMDN